MKTPNRFKEKRAVITASQRKTSKEREQLAEYAHNLRNEQRELTAEIKRELISELRQTHDHGKRELLVGVPLNAYSRFNSPPVLREATDKHNKLCTEYTNLIEQLRDSKVSLINVLISVDMLDEQVFL